MNIKRVFAAILLLWSFSSYSQDNYQKAWQLLNQNKRAEAEALLTKIAAGEKNFEDAYITNIYLKSYSGKESSITDFRKSFYSNAKNPYPYIYALWFNDALLGQYGKKNYDFQRELIDQLTEDGNAPGTLVSAANYQKGMDALYSANFKKVQQYCDAIGNIRNWQYTGLFENLSESGFNKNYGPLDHPEPSAVFKSITNADLKWFTPATEIKDGWTPVAFQFNNKQTAVAYAQNFVNSPSDQTVYCNAGFTGSIKIWINDELVISESKERLTEMDAYTVKVDLKKGVNRVLVQLGYSSISYPNFTIRFTDQNYKPIPDITGSSTYSTYPKITNSTKKYALLPHFAEAFFKDKIAKEPTNYVNYLLLADVYLRSKKIIEARDLVDEAINKAPDNPLLRLKVIEVLIKENNRTLLLEEIEKIKQLDPESLMVLELNIKEFFDNEKYEDGALELEKRIKLYGEDETTHGYKLMVLSHDKKFEELVKEAEVMYKKYPGNAKLLALMYSIKKEVYKDKKGAFKVFDTYMKNNYDYSAYSKYAELLSDAGENDKALDIKIKLTELFPYSPGGFYDLSKYYYTAKQYEKAEDQIKKALALSPYNEAYWEQLGDVKAAKKNDAEAMEAYNHSLKYDPNQYEIINKLRKLNGKTEMFKLFPETDITKTIKEDKPADAKNTDYGYYYNPLAELIFKKVGQKMKCSCLS